MVILCPAISRPCLHRYASSFRSKLVPDRKPRFFPSPRPVLNGDRGQVYSIEPHSMPIRAIKPLK